MPTIRKLLSLVLALALLAAACGDDDATDDAAETTAAATDETTSTTEAESTTTTDQPPEETGADDAATVGFPATIESSAGTFTLETAPQRIVSLSPSATEILFAIGAGEQVVAVDSFSTYPEGTPVTDLSGFDPNVEAITAFEPDLVVIAGDANDLVASLTALDIPVLANPAPADIESGYAGMAEIGVATGKVDEAAGLIGSLRDDIAAAFAAAPEAEIRIYHELDETYFSASSFGFIGSIYAEMGTVNIADEADTDGFGFPQLTEEYIVTADPELIVITDQVTYTEADVLARPGWGEIAAVVNGNVVTVNADIASRWGPRLPQFIRAVADALSSVSVSS